MKERWVRCDKETCGWWQVWKGSSLCEACEQPIRNWSLATQVASNIQLEEVKEILRVESRDKKNVA